MATSIDPDLAARLRAESEAGKDDPYPAGAAGARPNRQRSQVYSVRLSPQEQDDLRRLAEAKHLPASTLVRSWILERLDTERSA